jgi:hypothetical protein
MKEESVNTKNLKCPSCGTPVKRKFQVSEKVKIALTLLLVGYVVFSVYIFLAGAPPEMRRGCRSIDYRIHLPFVTRNFDHCRESEYYKFVETLRVIPGFQMFVYGGLLAGILIFYYDWFEEMYRKWKEKRAAENPNNEIRCKNKCRNCGREWN